MKGDKGILKEGRICCVQEQHIPHGSASLGGSLDHYIIEIFRAWKILRLWFLDAIGLKKVRDGERVLWGSEPLFV